MKDIRYGGATVSAIGISLSYGERVVLEDVSFVVPAEEMVALVGPNGTGKTTIIRLILGQEEPDSGKITASRNIKRIGYLPQSLADVGQLGDASLYGFMLSGRSLDKTNKDLEDIYQELGESSVTKSLLGKLEVLQEQYTQADGYEAERDIRTILSGLQIPTDNLEMPISLLSGGMKTRLFLARVLYSDPDFLILDEPTNHLDEVAIKWLGDYLRNFRGAGIIVSHHQDFLDKFCQRTLYVNPLTHKVETYRGNYSFFLSLRLKREEEQMKIVERQEREIKRMETFINRWRAGTRARQAQSQLKKLEKIQRVEKPRKERKIKVAFPIEERSGDPVVIIKEIVKSYDGKRLFPALSFSLRRGERIAIMGPNGAGKTTLLKMIVGLEQPDAGEVNMGYKIKIGYYAQEHEILDPNLTPIGQFERDFPGESYQRIRAVLGHFLLSEQSSTLISKLSQGEKSRLALASVVMSGANFLVLDEPTNHLDALSRERLIEALSDYEGSVLTVSHDEEYLGGLRVDRILALPEGKMIYK